MPDQQPEYYQSHQLVLCGKPESKRKFEKEHLGLSRDNFFGASFLSRVFATTNEKANKIVESRVDVWDTSSSMRFAGLLRIHFSRSFSADALVVCICTDSEVEYMKDYLIKSGIWEVVRRVFVVYMGSHYSKDTMNGFFPKSKYCFKVGSDDIL